jgi:hypothetical protein
MQAISFPDGFKINLEGGRDYGKGYVCGFCLPAWRVILFAALFHLLSFSNHFFLTINDRETTT